MAEHDEVEETPVVSHTFPVHEGAAGERLSDEEWFERQDREAAARVEAERERLEALLAKANALRFGTDAPDPVVAKFEVGTSLLEACEECIEVCIRDGVPTSAAWVELPRGWATVDFMLSVLALGGAA